METVKQNVKFLMDKLDYPENAQAVLMDALDTISANKVATAWLKSLIAQYDAGIDCNYKQMLADAEALGESLGIHQYASGMLLFLCLGEKLRERYAERGIDESIYYKSMSDLRYKLEECRIIYNVVGTFVASWYPGFFKLTRFGLGRLQFEMATRKTEFTVGGIHFPAGTRVINIHIPRTGTKLDHDEVLESYRMAAEMFASEFEDKPILISCTSWMLDPWHETVLPPTSNMIAFMRDFKIVGSGNYDSYAQVWRVFDKYYEGDVNALPADNTLRRAYADRIRRGEPTAWGHGVFIWRDGEIIND